MVGESRRLSSVSIGYSGSIGNQRDFFAIRVRAVEYGHVKQGVCVAVPGCGRSLVGIRKADIGKARSLSKGDTVGACGKGRKIGWC